MLYYLCKRVAHFFGHCSSHVSPTLELKSFQCVYRSSHVPLLKTIAALSRKNKQTNKNKTKQNKTKNNNNNNNKQKHHHQQQQQQQSSVGSTPGSADFECLLFGVEIFKISIILFWGFSFLFCYRGHHISRYHSMSAQYCHFNWTRNNWNYSNLGWTNGIWHLRGTSTNTITCTRNGVFHWRNPSDIHVCGFIWQQCYLHFFDNRNNRSVRLWVCKDINKCRVSYVLGTKWTRRRQV